MKAPKGYTKTDWGNTYHKIDDGASVYLNPMYVRDGESPKRYFVTELSKGFCLVADNKRMLANGEGYIYSIYDIDYFKNF